MSPLLYTLGRWAFRARGLVLGVWIAVLMALFAGAALLGTGTDNTYTIPGTESQEALDALGRTFPQVSGGSAQLIAVAPPGGSATDADFEAAVEASVDAIAQIPQVSSATSPYGQASANISADGDAVLVPIQLTVSGTAVHASTGEALQDAGAALQDALSPGSEVSVGGQLFSQSSTGISITELIGIGVAFVVLLFTFASLVAAGLPLVTAIVGVGASLSIVLIATRFTTITSTTPLLALMLGLAVGIDYALFVLARHQDQLKEGVEPEEAAARAIATSGSAVVFAALTVIIALLGLVVAGIPFLTTMGVAAAVAVALAVLVSLTLTPALLGFAKWRVVPRRYRPARHTDAAEAGDAESPADAVDDEWEEPALDDAEVELIDPAEEEADADGATDAAAAGDATAPDGADSAPAPRAPGRFFRGWVRTVTRWPLATVVLIVGLLACAALPAAHLRLALPDAGSMEEGEPGRVTYDLIAEHFGPGYNGPLLVTGSVIESTDPVGLMDDLGAEIAMVEGVASVPLTTPNETGDTGIVQVIPEGGPDSVATADLVATLRGMHDHFETEYGVDLSVTGYTAAGIDISERLAGALLPFGILVVGLSLVLLAMVFRSIIVPITAALGYVLSIGAAFGLTTLVFVDGVFADALNVASVGTVISFMPIILMGVLFGLAMDYEVFLVSRMREDYVHHGEPVRAVHDGFAASARVVTAAATIMFAVFVAFVPEGDANIQPIAFGLAVGVVIDAFLVRMTLIPAVLVLFGHRAWWMPAWLDRLLPSFDVEGEGLAEELALAEWPDRDLALAAEGARVHDHQCTLDAELAPGGILVIEGADAAERRAMLAALGGRAELAEGRVRVAGFVLPARTATVRARTSYWRVPPDAGGLDLALDSRPALVFVDGLDDVGSPSALRRVHGELTAARAADPALALVVAARDTVDVEPALPADAAPVVVRLADGDRDGALVAAGGASAAPARPD
ncbi:RND superfamily putative drug exporter [Microbacterium trichothecenolyticum]|uniref:MMPL family transporter n=1 Tax=Microbacterium trichothecenolyticum TaxID=69370 RepID=UPI00285BE80E|nr:MMPL family transporter [Microbacterium trichothecenolyticum]MDR7185172.1 RND superfamily putative drug exporter [Microbacterium trichothecenolyticum]